MTHPKFGNKYLCYSCSTKYYDMKKDPVRCPKCAADPKDDPALKASEKKGKGARDDAEPEDFEDEKFESDVDDLVNDDAEAEEEEADEEPAPTNDAD